MLIASTHSLLSSVGQPHIGVFKLCFVAHLILTWPSARAWVWICSLDPGGLTSGHINKDGDTPLLPKSINKPVVPQGRIRPY